MNYAEEQLQYAIEKESKQCDNTECGRNVSNKCKMSEFECIKIDKDYKTLWKQSVTENKELKKEIESKEELLQKYYKDAKERLITNKGTDIYINDLKEERDKYKEESMELRKLIKSLVNLM